MPVGTNLKHRFSVGGNQPGLPLAYRSAVAAVDVIAVPGTVTCTLINGVGALTAGTYTIFVVAGTPYGRTTVKQGNATVVTSGANLCAKAAFAAVPGATYYDIYCSTDGAGAKFTGRITEAQRASGIIIDTHNHTIAGGAVDSVYIYAVGTGLAANGTHLAVNTAYAMPADSPVNANGYQYVDFDLVMSRTGDDALPTLVVVPYFYNETAGVYVAGTPVTVTFGGASGNYQPLIQRVQVEARGRLTHLIVQTLTGTGAALTITARLS